MTRTHGVAELADPKTGEAVWMIINGEPSLRYFVAYNGGGCQVAFNEDLRDPMYHDLKLFFKSRVDAITFLIGGLLSLLDDARQELARRCAELCAAASDEQAR